MKKYTNHSENVALVCIIAIVAGLSSVLMTTSRQNRTGSGFPDDHLGSSVIVISTPVTYTAQTLTYDQDISITSTGSLHFDSCSVTMNSTMAHPALKIVVQRGGVLNITVSTIQASSAAYPYNIRVYGTLDAQGTDFWQSGFDTSDVTKSALYLNDAEHVRLIGCTIGVTTNGKGLHAVRGTDIDLNSVDFVGYMRAGATFDETNGLVLYGLAIFDSGSATNTIGLELINVSNAFLNETTISDFATSARFAGDCRNVTSINLQTIRTALVAGSIGCLVEPSASGGVPDDVILDGVYPTRQDVGMKIAGLVNRAITLSNVNIVTTNTAASFTNCMGLTVTNMNARSTNQLGYYFSNVTNTNILNARFQTTFPLNATRLDRGSDIVFENSTLNSTGSGSKDFVLQDSSNVTFFNSEFSEVKSAILSPTSHMLKGNYIRVFARDTNQIPIHGALVQKHSDGPGMSANFTTNSAGRVFRIPGIYRTLNALYISTMYNVTIEISYLGLTFTGSPTAILDLRTPLSLIFGASGILVDPWVISDPVSYNNREFIINGDLVINSTAIFTSCRIRMFSTGLVNRSIIILDAGYLIADYTNFTTYSGYSFKFNATSGSSTALSNCIVMDAGWQSYDGIHMEPIDLIKSGMYFLEPEVVRLSFCLITGSPVLVTLDSSSTSEALLEYSTFQSDLVAPNDIGVLLLDCARVRVDSNNFYDLDTGVLLNTTSPYAGIENVISYNEFTVNDKSGIKGIVSKETLSASISPNTVSFNSFIDIGIGIEFNSLKEYQVLNNSFNYCATSVKVLQASTLNISGNAIDYGTGIELQSATAVYIQHNTMVHLAALGGNGIIVTGTVSTLSIQENLIAHNIETPAGTGMRISNANIGNITITDNNLEYLSVGISIVDVTANLQIEGNTINDTRYGISINGTSNVLIFNNTVNRAVVLGIEVRNDVGKSIISSVIANNTLDAGNSNGVLIKINDMQFENNTVKSFVGYAVILDTITSIRYRRNLLDNPNNLDVRACNGILLEKSTIVSTGYAFMLQNSLVKLYQVTFDAARIRLRDVNSRLSLINFLMVSAIDSISNPVVGATVTINSTWNISNITLITGATGFTQNTTVEYQGFRRGYDNATRSVVVSVKYQAMVFLSNDRIIPMSSDRLESFTATQLFDIEAPAMNEPVFQPEAPLANESVTVSCEITDNVAVDDVFLYYRANYTSWIRISMGYINPLYFAVIPNFGKGTNVQFWIFANDTINNIATRDNLTQLYAYRVKESNALKVIGTIVSPASPLNNQSFIVNTTVYDDSGIQSVSIQLFNPLGGFFDNVNLVNYNATGPGNVSYWGSINPMTSFGGWNITFVIVVYDIFGNNNISTGIGIIFINGTTPPVIGKLETQYAFPSNKENNTISVQVDFTDAGVWVELHYRTFGTSSWTSVLMTYTAANWFEYIMPPFTSGTVIEYYVSATDVSNLTTVLNNNSHYYTFESKKTTPPDISSIVYVPTTPDDENPVNITATVTDNSTLRSVDLLYSIDLGNTWHIIHMNMSQELVPGQQYVYFGSIPAHTYGTKVYFKIEAMDEYNNTFTSPLDSYWIYSYGVNVPLNPAYIYVPTASLVGLSILFFGLFGDQIRVTRRKKRIQKRRNID